MLRTLIVGAGRSGRGLHLQAVNAARKRPRERILFAPGRVLAVDPRLAATPGSYEEEMLEVLGGLWELRGSEPNGIVAHVCTPPIGRGGTLRALGEFGVKKVLCEKPLAASEADLEAVLDAVETFGLDVGVVSPWLSSALTTRIAGLLSSGMLGRLHSISIHQQKPRFSRTRANPNHPTAFEIEIPHAVALALHLGGREVSLVGASANDMQVDGVTLKHLGGARMRLRHVETGVETTINSDLTAPIRRRSVSLVGERGAITGYYSACGDDHYVQLHGIAGDDLHDWSETFLDEPFVRMIVQWYAYFGGLAPKPVSDIPFNLAMHRVIAEAKTRSGIVVEPQRVAEVSVGAV